MSWFDYMEQRKKLFVGGTVTICLAMLAVTVRRFNVSFDSYWHLQIGLDWLEKGLSPWRDHFSFTFHAEEVSRIPFMFEWLLGWLVMHFELEPGFQIFKLAAFALVFGLVVLFLRILRAPVVVYCLVLPVLVVLLQLRSIVRPELISYSFSVIAIILYHRARGGISVSGMLPVLGLMLLWANYHSPILGYIIFFGYFLDMALQQFRDRAPMKCWLQWLGWGLAIVAVGFLHPGFNHALISFLNFSPEWKGLIQEFQSAVLYREVAAIYSLVAIALVTSVSLFLQKQFGLLFICLFLGYFSFDMVRLVTPSGIVILCIFAWTMSEIELKTQLQALPLGLSRAIGGAVLALSVLSIASSMNMARAYMEENKTSQVKFPEDVANYMIKHDIAGRIFNEYGIGGYLIHRLSPHSQVYIDGRTGILYPVEHYLHLLEAKKSPDILRSEIEKYDINLAVLKNKRRNFRLVIDTGALQLDYVGSKFSLFRKNNPNFPIFGALLAYPSCWKFGMSADLEEELARANLILPNYSMLFHFMEFVMDYSHATDKVSFLTDLDKRGQWTDSRLRFAGYQALNQNLNLLAYELFTSITDKEFSDYLGSALANVRLGEWSSAEQLLDTVTRISWSENLSEISILYGLLSLIRQNSELELFDDAYVNRLAGDIRASGDSTSPFVPDSRSFCPDT